MLCELVERADENRASAVLQIRQSDAAQLAVGGAGADVFPEKLAQLCILPPGA